MANMLNSIQYLGHWGTLTGSFILSDGEDVILAHRAADECDDEWTEVYENGKWTDVRKEDALK